MTRVILAVLLVLASLAPAPAAADVFRWTDEQGVTHTIDPQRGVVRLIPSGDGAR